MAAHQISRTTIVAVLVTITAALVGRSWLQIELMQRGMQNVLAANLSYLLVPPILIMLLFPLWRNERPFIKSQFRWQDLSWRLAMSAIVVGILIRFIWWSQLIAGVSFGIYSSSTPDVVVGPIISFQCASLEIVIPGFFVMVILVPIIEESVHRGYIQTAIQHKGFVIAVITSSLVFVILHRLSSWPFVFFTGLVLGTQYWLTRSLWASLITHAMINGLIQIDWRCLSVQWNPRATDLPLLVPGLIAATVLVLSLASLATLLYKIATEASNSPR